MVLLELLSPLFMDPLLRENESLEGRRNRQRVMEADDETLAEIIADAEMQNVKARRTEASIHGEANLPQNAPETVPTNSSETVESRQRGESQDEPQHEPGSLDEVPFVQSASLDASSSHYAPIRIGNPLMTALRRDLNLLDHGRPSTQRPANVNDVLLNYEEVLLVEKRRGRKEIFRHELSECHMSRLKAARRKEWNKIISSGAMRVLSVEESNHIRQNPQTRKRLLKSRFVYTKTDDEPLNEETDLKARWCVRGYLDPDLLSRDTEAPTLSADGCAVAL